MEILNEYKKIIIFAMSVFCIIIVYLVFFNKEHGKKFDRFKESQVDSQLSGQYITELIKALSTSNVEFVKSKVEKNYLTYLNISENDFNNYLIEQKLYTNNVKIIKTQKIKYNDIVIYRYTILFNGLEKQINIIETYPEKWVYTLDNFMNYQTQFIRNENNQGYGAIINSIYQDINYIEFKCTVYVDESSEYELNTARSDSIKLLLEDGSSFIMATNNFSSEYSIIGGKKYFDIDCIFNIPIGSQDKIKSIVFNNFESGNTIEGLKIDLGL